MAVWVKLRSRFFRRALCAFVFVAAVIATGRGAPAQTAPPAADKSGKAGGIVATVNGIPIFRRDVERDITNAAQGQTISAAVMPRIQATALQNRIDAALKQSYLTSQQISASKEEVDATIEQLRAELRKQKVTFDNYLAGTKQTETGLRQNLAEQIAWSKLVQKNMTDENMAMFFKQF